MIVLLVIASLVAPNLLLYHSTLRLFQGSIHLDKRVYRPFFLYYGNYNFSYYSFFLRGYKGLKVVTICYYKYLYINIYNYIFIYTFLYLHFKSVILGQNKTVITEIVICNRFFSGIEMHTFIAPKTMTISSQSYEL